MFTYVEFFKTTPVARELLDRILEHIERVKKIVEA